MHSAQLVKVAANGILAHEDISPNKPRRNFSKLVPGEGSGGDAEDIIQFLQGSLLGLWKEKEDQEKGDGIQSSVESKSSRWRERPKHIRKGEREHRSPEIVGRHGPGHTYFTMGQWKHFCRVGKRHRALTRRVKDVEEIDEQRNQTQMGIAVFGNPETESGG